ncbi:MAG: hypothetical protein KH231_07670 [Dialister sp.]|uniref:hypothetical protein n=1 Tax=Dialister sp. TaxID=1955814 RepID=UPI001DF025C6|nr:hypothetical protein [Dialister sp.]MBS6715326.1 hypothetical protein [Dialister sp.]
MGFRNGSYARLWQLQDEGKYCVGQISISKKNKETNQYDVVFQDGYVRFVGDAYKIAKDILSQGITNKGVSIKIGDCDVTNNYSKEKKRLYTNYVIFSMELPDGNSSNSGSSEGRTSKEKKETSAKVSKDVEILDDDDDDLPF